MQWKLIILWALFYFISILHCFTLKLLHKVRQDVYARSALKLWIICLKWLLNITLKMCKKDNLSTLWEQILGTVPKRGTAVATLNRVQILNNVHTFLIKQTKEHMMLFQISNCLIQLSLKVETTFNIFKCAKTIIKAITIKYFIALIYLLRLAADHPIPLSTWLKLLEPPHHWLPSLSP